MHQPLKAPFPWMGGKSRIASLVWKRFGAITNYVEPFAGSLAVLLRRPPGWRGVETVNDVTGGITNTWRSLHPTQGAPSDVADVAIAHADAVCCSLAARQDVPACETVCDLDPHVANVWRAIQSDPDGVAEWADQPVNELNLHAMHRWLVLGEGAVEFREQMRADPGYYDVQRAGYWLAGICMWIGGAWCRGVEDVERHENAPPTLHPGHGLNQQGPDRGTKQPRKRPHIGGDSPGSVGKGVHAGGRLSQQLPEMCSGRGMDAAPGVSLPQGRPQLADAFDVGRGVHSHGSLGTCAERRAWLLDWFGRLRDRLRLVRVLCGHWLRACDSPSVTTRLGITGVFLDPPYRIRLADGSHNRSGDLYATDGSAGGDPDAVVDEVIAYCLERGGDPMMRLAVCGYEGEGYEVLEQAGWEVVAWKTQGGYANQGKAKKARKGKASKSSAQDNASRERIWFSPHCVRERTLFDGLELPVEIPSEDQEDDLCPA